MIAKHDGSFHINDDEMFGYERASKVTGLKVSTLYSMVARRQIPFYRLGKRLVVFSHDELVEWLKGRRVEVTP